MKHLVLTTLLVLTFVAPLSAVYYEGSDVQPDAEVRYAEDVLIINFEEYVQTAAFSKSAGDISTGLYEVDNIFIDKNVQKLEKLFKTAQAPDKGSNKPDLSRYYRIEFPNPVDIHEMKAQLEQADGVGHVELVGIHPIMAVPDDNFFSTQWHHNRASDIDIDSPEAWDVETGDSAVIVAIVDTGVQWDHPDLAGAAPYTNGNIWINWDEFNGTDGVDDDGNGYVDDYRGWDWVSVTGAWSGEDATTPDNDPMDFNGHGTHCAGIAAAITNNGLGVAGVAGGFYPSDRGSKIMSLRAGWSAPHPTGGYETGYVRMDFCAEAFYYAVDNGADVISCSWGSSNSGGIAAALSYAVSNDVIVCKAAGNSASTSADYLCSQPSVVSVASTTSSDTKSSFSNYGAWVDISAPGSGIYSTYSNHGSATFATLSGTSMACPMAAGLCALIKSRDLSLTKSDIETIMFNSADDISDENPGYVGMLGAGRINSFNAVNQLVYITLDGTPRMGLPPLTVNFAGDSPFDIQSWKYEFGDGDTSVLQNPQHIYDQAGAYSVVVEATSPLGDVTQTLDNYVFVLADTVEIGQFEGDGSTTAIQIPVRLNNVGPVNEIILPIQFSGPLNLDYVDFTVDGTRADYFERAQLQQLNYVQKILVFRLVANDGGGSPPLSPGNGDIIRINFNLAGGEGVTNLEFTTINDYELGISTHLGDYVPEELSGSITISNALRGDANADGAVNVSDAVHIINYVFVGGLPPATQCAGDANNDGLINVSDAVFIINYVFVSGSPEPVSCF